HEIVGYAIRVGSIAAEKAGIKVGDRVGVGAQIGSCGDCRVCGLLRGNYCTKKIETYNDYYPDGTLSQGGYGTAIRANHRFVVPIPEGIKSEHAASMMCAGLTMYSPLTRQNVGPGSRVGIVGLGGLGHYGVLFAKALGAEVYAFSPDASKEEDMKKLGADHYVIATEENMAPLARTFDVILSTVDVVEGFSLGSYLRLLFVEGIFVNIGLPDHMLPQISPFDLVLNGCRLGGSLTGSKTQAIEMFKLAKAKNVQPWVEVMPMSKLKEAVEGAKAAKARYRYVLEQDLVPYSPA
ncbi:NADP-dependent alcohol dehydrogenase, partial [Ceratobasidium sp. 428]